MEKKVTIELTERQARVLLCATEEYFRLRLGQAETADLADDLAFANYDKSKDSAGKGFALCLQTRNHIHELLKTIFRLAWPTYGTPERRSEQELIAGDIWSQLRWELSPKSPIQSTPIQLGPEPLPKITVAEVPDGTSN